jgi:chemotaxis protein CheZ
MSIEKQGTGTIDESEDLSVSTETLKKRTRQLLRELDEGNLGAATASIRDLGTARDETLYYEVGRLTRALHNALKDFHLEFGLQGNLEVENELSEIADARSRLNHVIRMTEDAANRTMDMVEAGAPVAQQLCQEAESLHRDWQRVQVGDAVDADMHARLNALLGRTAADTSMLSERFNDILMAQGYQDLSGQVIKRVIGLVSDVEKSLVRLVKIAANVEAVAGLSPADNDTVKGEERADIRAEGPSFGGTSSKVVSGQDDVDELLSSLGF